MRNVTVVWAAALLSAAIGAAAQSPPAAPRQGAAQDPAALVLESLINKFFASFASKSGDSGGQGTDSQGKGPDKAEPKK